MPLHEIIVTSDATLLHGSLKRGWIALDGGMITKIGAGPAPKGKLNISAGGDPIGPPLVDTHIHGFGGFDASECGGEGGEETLRSMARALLISGVGAFCPTIYPLTPKATEECLKTIANVRAARRPGESVIIGAHLEGPFVNPARSGALEIAKLLEPNTKIMEGFLDTGAVSMITIAPELRGAAEMIKMCAKAGIVVSMGHSAASFDNCKESARLGARSITHIFNAMAPVHHRDASIANFGLLESDFPTELIADLQHVSAPAVDLLISARGLDGIRLVSDNLAAAGTNAKKFRAGGANLTVKNGIAYRSEGNIAGSCRTLASSVAGLARTGLLTIGEAWRLASEEPAKLLKPAAVAGFARLSGE